MADKALTEHLEFLVEERGEDEATVLARALQTGLETLYREALIEAYLLGRISRDAVSRALTPNDLREIEVQRDALRRDVEWGARIA
jgi:hypothetical protein